jgi:hypothetical protein
MIMAAGMLCPPDEDHIVSETCRGTECICKGDACVTTRRSFASLHKQDEKKKMYFVTQFL